MARKIITGIDAGTSRIKVVVAEQKNGRDLHILGLSQKTSQGMRRGYIVNFEDAVENVRSAIKSAEKTAAVPIKHAYVAIGGIGLSSTKSKGSVMISRPDGEVTEYDLKRVMEQCESNLSNISNKQIIHGIPLSFKIDGAPVLGKPLGMKGAKMEAEALFITSLNQHILDLIKAIESAGVVIDDIVASPLAASSVVLAKHQKEVGCVLANIGAGTVSLVVFEEGKPISLEVFPIGSIHITNDIALGLKIPLDEAEKIKLEYSPNPHLSKRQLSNIIEARLNDIFELIESHLKKINRNRLLPAGIILTGGGSNLFSLEDVAKASLHLPAKISIPLPLQNLGINIAGSYKDRVLNDPGWSVALGLCLPELINSDIERPEVKVFGNAKSVLKRLFRLFLP